MNKKKAEAQPEVEITDAEELPEAWRWTPLSETVEIIMGQSPPGESYNSTGEGVPLINGPVEFGPTPFSDTLRSKFTSKPTKMCKKNDLILCVRGSTTGRINIAGFDSCVGRGVAALRSKENQKFLNYFIHFKERDIFNLGTGSTFPNIQSDKIANIAVPLPPPPEQQRIVTSVETILTHVNAARDQLNRVPLVMKRFRQGVLEAACSGRLTEGWREEWLNIAPVKPIIEEIRCRKTAKKNKKNIDIEEVVSYLPEIPEKWEYVSLPEVVADSKNAIKRGPFGSSIKKAFFTPKGYKIFEQRNVIYNDFSTGRYFIDDEKFQELKDFEIKTGDVVISCSGTIGKIAVVPENIEKGIMNQALLKITFNKDVILPSYYEKLFKTDIYQKKISSSSRGSAMQNISSVSEIKDIPIPLPPLPEQHEIIRCVGVLFARADAVERDVTAVTKRTEALTQAVLAKAFAGKL